MKLFTLFILLTLSACSTITNVREYDSDALTKDEQRDIIANESMIYTEDLVVLAETDGVYVTNVKVNPIITFDNDYEIKQDRWNVVVFNSTDKDLCVGVVWKLMDYKFVSEFPSEFFVGSGSQLSIGKMVQMVWEIEGVKFTPEGSGYVHDLAVRDLEEEYEYEGLDDMDKCLQIEKEEDIVER